jgi:hypothetical protein
MPMTAEMEEMSKPKLTNSPRRQPHAPLAAAPPRPDPILLRGDTTLDYTHLDVVSPRN